MIPDAVLQAFVEAKGAREATAAIAGVQQQLRECRDEAVLATNAVNRFGRVRGIAVLDVNAAKAKAEIAEAQKDVDAFGREHATAALEVTTGGVTRSTAEATREVRAFGDLTAEARADLKIAGATAKILQLRAELADLAAQKPTPEVQIKAAKAAAELDRTEASLAKYRAEALRASQETRGLGGSFEEFGTSKRRTDKLVDENIGTFGRLARSIRGTGDAAVGVRGSLGPLSGGLGVVATAALFFGTSLLSIAGPAVAVVAALAPLVGLAAGAAGGLVAAAQGFGVFKLATLGVLDALKEQNKAQQTAGASAAQQAGQQVAAARQIKSAQEGLRQAKEATANASRSLDEAQRTERQAVAALGPAYSEARKQLRDMRDAVVSANLSLRDAQFAAQDARKALTDLLSGPSPRELADAHTAVTDALRGENNAAMDLADAYKALNDLMAPPDVLTMADAQDQVADSIRDQERARLALNKTIADTNAVLADPNATDDQKAQARLDLADAENAVGDAARQTEHAQQALAKLEAGPTQDEIARARGRVADAEAAVGAAKRSTLDAQEQLSKVEAGPSSDEIARARLALAEAENGLSGAVKDATRAARDYGLAEAQGLARSPSVVAAREAVRSATLGAADAERALADAQRQEVIAARNVRDAQADAARSAVVAGGAAENLNQKMNALPAPAQAFVRALQSMKPRLDDLRTAAAGGFFPGATAGLQAAMGSFDSVKKVIGETAVVLGDAAKKSGELVGSPAFGKDLETIGGRNARVLETLGQAARHVVSAIRNVLVVAGPLEQWLANTANGWALNAAEAAKTGRENGKLAGFLDRTRAVAERLGSILGHLAHGLFGVGKAGTDSGNQILASIDRASARFDAWANSVNGQHSIQDFFAKTKEVASALVPAVANLAKGFGILSLRVLPVATVLKALGPYADEAVIAFVAWKVAISAVNVVTKLFAAQAAIAAFLTGGWTTAFWALNAALAANPIGLVVLAVAALAAAFVLAWHHCETFRDIVTGALHAVGAVFDWLLGVVETVFGWLADHWPLVLGILTGPIGLAVSIIATHTDMIVAFFTALPGRIADAIKAGAAFFAGAVAWIKDQIVNGIEAYIALYVGVGSWVVNRIVDGIKLMATAIVDGAGWIKNRLVDGVHATVTELVGLGTWVLNRIVDGIKVITDALASVGGWLKNRIMDALTLAADGFVAAGSWVINRVVEGVRTISDDLAGMGGWLKNRLTDAFDAAKDGFLGLGSTVIGWIVDGLKAGGNDVVDFLNDIIHVINKLPGVQIGDIKHFATGGKNGGSAADQAKAQVGLARGGAFARTGGLVSAPITMMGEEAPLHPEYVIPTNPAYRDRARMLLVQAAGALGLAAGGIYSEGEIEDIWKQAGGRAQAARTMAIIAEAESSGNALINNGGHVGRLPNGGKTIAAGLWQILGLPFPGDPYDAITNARMAIAKSSNGQNLHPWDASRSVWGPLIGGGGGGGIVGAVTGALSSVGGIIGDLISKGASFLLDQLPGVGDLPDWLKGAGHYLLDHVGDFIKDKVSSLISDNTSASPGPAGGPAETSVFKGVVMATWVKDALQYAQTKGVESQPTSGYRPGPDPHTATGASEHQGTRYPHGAVDFGGFNTGLAAKMAVVNATRDFKWPLLAPIGFHDDGHASGTGHYRGGIYGKGLLGSFQAGTDYVPETGPYLLHKGEAVTPAGESPTVRVIFEGLPVELQRLVRVEIEQDGRRSRQAWNAGVRPGVSR